MSAEETRGVTVSLVIRLDDIRTGRQLMPDDTFRISSGDGFWKPLPKADGYFVFTGPRPDSLRVVSKMYETVCLPLGGVTDLLLRIAPVPLPVSDAKFFPLTPEAGESAHVGFYSAKSSYPAASSLEAGMRDIVLHKEDYADITGLFHAVVPQEGQAATVFIKDGLGYGKYLLPEPLGESIPRRRTRFLPLYRIVGTGGTMIIPVPEGCEALYVLRGGVLEKTIIK